MPQVISASRRTDVPAFYTDWFVNRLRAGTVHVQQPYTSKLIRVSLEPENVSAIIFWSKDFAPLLRKLEVIEKTTKNLFFHFTITANRELEPDTPDYRDAIADFIFITRRYSPEQIIWRYDPICITDTSSSEINEERFIQCAELLKGYAQKCTISYVHPYKKVLENLKKKTGHALIDLSVDKKREYAHRLAARSEVYGIHLSACCNDYLLSEKIKKAICIDGRYLTKVLRTPADTRRAATRKECACTTSIDIGAYNTCAHGCLYCYANDDKDRPRLAQQRHNPEWSALSMNVSEAESRKTEKQGQLFQDD
ncbi:MAG TPA: DUF1848 domain-containing protein [Nitrospirota bacterium]|nr:DUF1848 domain-containing protein [Nitrospirota bacterium]